MTTMLALTRQSLVRICCWTSACAVSASVLVAQAPPPRIGAEIRGSELVTLPHSHHPLAQPQFDAGRLPAETRLNGVSILFKLSPAQQLDLDALLAAQQDARSPLFHQWLTPEQYAARFGMAQSDLDSVQTWLQQQGFSVDRISRGRNLMRFSGTVVQVERAFSTEMHYYAIRGKRHFAPSTDLQIPAALLPVVAAIRNLDDFRPRPYVIPNRTPQVLPGFTSGVSGKTFLSPADIVTTYDAGALRNSGYIGTGQSIAIVGQSDVAISDIESFQNAAGLPVKDPVPILTPNSGTPAIYSGDESESDLDLEWSGAMAPGAQIYFVYVGNNQNSGVFDALIYAINERIANIVSVSYGECEQLLDGYSIETYFKQANSQGQTILAASGDNGSTACYGMASSQTVQQELAVSYPASSPNVTAVGGTEIPASDLYDGLNFATYWNFNNSDITSSAKSYIPEVVWNDDSSTGGLSAAGGGKSTLFTKPAYQVALTPADSMRDLPDISLYASPNAPGYLYCTSDATQWGETSTGLPQQASCSSGFRDAATNLLTVAGGTSFSTPIFAGMLAAINQKANYSTGSGNINTELYALANTGGSYSAGDLFHDVTTGANSCTAGVTFCNSSNGATFNYLAGAGYDLATGLGSVDLTNLANAWGVSTSTRIATTTVVSTFPSSPTTGTAIVFTITVTAASGPAPTGSVTLLVDGGSANGGANQSASLTPVGGSVSTTMYQTSFSVAAPHTVIAQFAATGSLAASSGAASVNVTAPNSGIGSFSIAATPTVTVPQGSSGTATITVVPAGGYTGTVSIGLSTNPTLTNLCYSFTTTTASGYGHVSIAGPAPVTTSLTLSTVPSSCGLMAPGKGNPQQRIGGKHSASSSPHAPAPFGIAFAGLALMGLLARRGRGFGVWLGVLALLTAGLGISACGSGSSAGGSGGAATSLAKGTYTVYLSGQDSATGSTVPVASTHFTFVIQ